MKVVRKKDEPIERLLKRFKKVCQDADIAKSYKEHEYYQGTKRSLKKKKREKTLRKIKKDLEN